MTIKCNCSKDDEIDRRSNSISILCVAAVSTDPFRSIQVKAGVGNFLESDTDSHWRIRGIHVKLLGSLIWHRVSKAKTRFAPFRPGREWRLVVLLR